MRYVPYDASPTDRPPRMAVAVRPSTDPKDLIACARLSAGYNDEDVHSALVSAQKHVAKPRNALFIAVSARTEIVGYARVSWVNRPPDAPDDAVPSGYYLGGMVVDERYRRRGIGSRLTRERMKFIAQRSADVWYLVNRDNKASIDLHDEYGFHEATRRFSFPGVVLDGPGGILCHARVGEEATRCAGCRHVSD
ncbi:MAG TPA: GNAT family N-acetyltransferase [Candidatus Stackebrandtia excrementipullorum]|nr:GNAT family N-acetyltransferase [Candidatus Stackebrandtia excrementipullorum]